MKARKLPGFGRLGVEIYDIDLQTASREELIQLGFINLEQLVTVIRKDCVGGISLKRYHEICDTWALELPGGGYEQSAGPAFMEGKYGKDWAIKPMSELDDLDRRLIEDMNRMRSGLEDLPGMVRITGKRDNEGHHLGMFADGELVWHSNQQGTTHYAPIVALLAWEGATGSCTEFLNTVDAYRDLSPEWQRTCDELIAVHRWKPGAVAPKLNDTQDRILQMNMVPVDDSEVPLVTVSPGGYKGMHFPFGTIHHFKGMSQEESDKVLAYLKEHVLRDEYIYSHVWTDGDLLFFEQTVTLHRRPTIDCSKREMYRVCFNFDNLLKLRAQRSSLAEIQHITAPGMQQATA